MTTESPAMLSAHPRIPYGESDFQRIRRNRWPQVTSLPVDTEAMHPVRFFVRGGDYQLTHAHIVRNVTLCYPLRS